MKAARSCVFHHRNRLLLQAAPLRTPAQSRRVLTTSIPVASPSSSSPPGHGHGKAFNSSLAVDSIASGNPAEFATINQLETSQTFLESTSPIKQHQKLVQSGVLRSDDHQVRIIGKLQRFWEQLLKYDPPPIPEVTTSNSLLHRLFSRAPSAPESPPVSTPKGLYLYGDVGTGKTMLMDLFYQTLPPYITRKRRVHFHAFMIDAHKRIHASKIAMGHSGGDPIAPVARDLAKEAYVLCFDEFQVTDIADAMILRRLLEGLMNHGVVCVMTSNRHPDDLYKNGIQRSSFIPAIELLKTRFEVTDLDSGTDYRRIPRVLSHVYYHPLTPENNAEIDKIFNSLTCPTPTAALQDPVIKNRPITTWGRTLHVPLSTSKVARFSFEEICGRPLSAADYLEVTKQFGTLFITDVPKMGMDKKDMARRFITFIDACYESKTKIFISSEVPIYQIFSDESAASGKGISDHMRSVMDDLGLSPEAVGSSSMFSGDEEIFAFARACSRLVQMGSKEWAETSSQ
ncbi:AFG1-like ATPase-domain-containing protein [Suillus paluster]|uniref:AFG1-like ATPase-domain-containing protein n=1 Tax=Suillus paluster TaxID=48578 RepID=UPI001B87E89C|nr:AFG1-like ATPase-domain-containing protein [Suillus paluster]KAG1752528.1 AFG1-like ATPase-domain-containing protein [Suillus paluster]